MSLHKFRDYSMVKIDIDVRVANATLYAMEIVRMDCRRNCEDDLKEIWQSWDEAKKTRFRDKYYDRSAQDIFDVERFRGPLANLIGLLVDTLKVRLKDKNGPCISWSNIRDALGKVSGDKQLALFVLAVYELIVF
ncbi:hypothetical protein Goshw_018064 [Gossypium schwendimanii]|uniref:Uncharacterized protein n=1 Tax=Gossypium schwendimanii TaxID=34291 RepID=A0A7J9L440_GOSSC|nr:hypothetical protein [Gossypium schwendimanii]